MEAPPCLHPEALIYLHLATEGGQQMGITAILDRAVVEEGASPFLMATRGIILNNSKGT